LITDFDKIKKDVLERKIKKLCHFTQSRKLPHILGDTGGIFSTDWLQENRPDIIDQNDPVRLDGFPNYISCSIEYPNTWYLKKAKVRDPLFKDWCIVLVKPDVIWMPKTRFAYRNAAALRGNINEGFKEYLKMFSPSISGAYNKVFNRKKMHLPSCPTDGQAEVLVYEKIPLKLIIGLGFKDEEHAKLEICRLQELKIDLNDLGFFLAPHFFDDSWRNFIENGKTPVETIYNVEPS
jgi:hypothetical protein